MWRRADGKPDLGQVTGTVTLHGQPLAEVNITFAPEGVRSAAAKTDAAGKYELTYIRDDKGAAIGTHKVLISKLVDEVETIPRKCNVETTLSAEVRAGANEHRFELTSD